mgnify:CR=1 FL=1
MSLSISRKIPSSPAVRFPRSPACLTSSFGAPCSFPSGLKWPPRQLHYRYICQTQEEGTEKTSINNVEK